MIVGRGWSDLHVSINWREDLDGLHIACSFDLKVPSNRRGEVAGWSTLINEQLLFRHFDLWATEGNAAVRNGLLLTGGGAGDGGPVRGADRDSGARCLRALFSSLSNS
jgi:hypothetical protein